MKFKLSFSLLIFWCLIIYSCRDKPDNSLNGTRNVTLFFDPSYSAMIEKYRVRAMLDDIKVLDTQVKNTHINNSLSLTCFPIDTNKSNVLTLMILNKSRKINLNKYHTFCINVFSGYDDRTTIRNMFEKYQASSIKKSGVIPDYKKYYDKLMATHPGDKYDSLFMNIDTKRCLCDSD